MVIEEDLTITDSVDTDIKTGQKIKSFSNRYRKKDGGIAYNIWSSRWDESTKLFYSVARDGKEKREQEEKLLQSEQRFKALVTGAFDLVGVLDTNGYYLYLSPSITAIAGIPPEEFIGKNAFEFVHPNDIKQTLADLEKVKKEDRVIAKPYRAKNHKNEWRWVESVLTNMLDNPAINGIVVNSRDITEKLEQEKIIRQSELRFKELVQEGSDLIAILDVDGTYTYVSPTSNSILGIPPEKFIGRSPFEFIHPDDAERVLTSLQKATKQHKVMVESFRFQNNKEEWRWIETVLTNMLDNPAVNGIVANSRDITDKIEEEQKLKLLESVITNTKDAVLITEAEPLDEPGPKIIYVNDAFTKMTGYTAEEVIGKTPRILQGPKSNLEDLAKLSKALRNWEPYEITTINYKKNREEFWINFTVTPVANEIGWYTHWIAIERDVTKQKTEELEKELINKINSIFNQKVDNDLSTTLSNICGEITRFGNFSFAEMWLPTFDNKKINCTASYSESKAGKTFFKESKKINSFAIEEGLTEQILKYKEAVIWESVDDEWNLFKRKAAAEKAGIKSLIAIPIIHNTKLLGGLLIGTEKTKASLYLNLALFKKLELTLGSELSRKKTEVELAQIFNFTPDMICVVGFDGYIKRMNPAGLKLLKYSLDEIRSKPIKSFVHEDDQSQTERNLKKLQTGENLNNFENRYITKDGKVVWLSWTATSLGEQGTIYAVAKNITEEKNLRELNRLAGKLAKIGSWEINVKNETIYWSNEVHQLHDTNSNSYKPTIEETQKFYREDFQEFVQLKIENCIATGENFDFEAVKITANKKEIWVRVIGEAEIVNGECIRVYGSFQDIHERKEAELRLQSLANNLPGVVFQYYIYPDATDNLMSVTKGSLDVWGYSAEEVMKNNQLVWNQITAGGDIENVQKSISNSVASNSKWSEQWKYVMPNGEIKTHLGYGSPSYLADGTVVFNSVILDITKEAQNEILLEQTTKLARVDSWEMDLINQQGEEMYWSPMIREILEIDDSYNPSLTKGIEFHIGESRDRIKQALKLLISENKEFDEEILLRTAEGNERWMRAIGKSEMVNNQRTRIFGSYQDIHKQKTAALELDKSLKTLEDYKSALDQSAIVAVTDAKGIITSINSNFCVISKFDRKELLGKTHSIINSGHHPEEFFKDLWETIKSGRIWRAEIKNKAKDGSFYWIDTTIVPFLNSKNIPFQYLTISFDITERKKAEQERHNLQVTLENSLNEIYMFDSETFKFYYANKGALINLGYTKSEIKELTPLDIKPDYTTSFFKKLIAPLVNNDKEKIIFFTNHERKDGSLYPVEVHLQLVTQANDERFLAVILDITERKKAEQVILQANERFEKVTEATHDAIWDWDISNQTYYRSKAIENFFGKETSKSLSHKDFWKDAFHPEDLADTKESLSQALSNPLCNRWEAEYRVFVDTGEVHYVLDRGIIIRNDEGKAIRIIGAMTNVSDQKNYEVQLKELNRELEKHALELERSNKELEQFAFVTSHDLQEPLRMISGFMDQLKRKYGDQLDEKALQYIYFATDGAKRMKQIILDLLDYSRASKPSEEIEKVNLNEVIETFKQLRRKVISESSATIITSELPSIKSYNAVVTQIFHGLLDNAIKYSRDGVAPIIEIQAEEKEKEWEFSVTDNGIGIDSQFFDKIFIIFQRLHNRNKYDGTGIGLAIVKRSVEFLNGTIWLSSTVGKGTTFHFTITKNSIKQ